MSIPDTIKAVRDLAAEVPHDAVCTFDDEATLNFILATCTPPLAPAAEAHIIGMFHRLRARAVENARAIPTTA